MKFGKLPNSELDKIDLTLPEDHPQTAKFLKGLQTTGDPEIYVGCAKWGRKEWIGLLFEEGTKEKDFLREYKKHFNSIELNATFYQTKKAYIEKWAEDTPEGFKFCPKFTRIISHIKRMKESEDITKYYVDAISLFGENLGVSFLQIPENFAPKYFDRLSAYMDLLPMEIPVTVELRHPDWFGDEVVRDETLHMLEEKGKGAVITDVAGRRDVIHQRITTDSVFIRFNGYDLHPTDFTRMDAWVDRIKSWIDMGLKKIYFIAHQEDETNTPKTAAYFIEKINEKCGLNVKAPMFIN